MTHPADHVYRFATSAHWDKGYKHNLVVLNGHALSTPVDNVDGQSAGAVSRTADADERTSDQVQASAQPVEAFYITPVLRSPEMIRAGWLRADVFADLPPGGCIKIGTRGFNDPFAFSTALRDESDSAFVLEGWSTKANSEHFEADAFSPVRHYLGDESSEYLAIRIHISLPAGSPPAQLLGLDVIFPDRSLIEDLPPIYRSGDASEKQLRRMLSPFQALADEIDDLVGNTIRRIDAGTPNLDQLDDLWSGYLLSWLGHGEFASLPATPRRKLLKALPKILSARGTLEGLAQALEAIAPAGFSIEDPALGPDMWILPEWRDPAGARLGRDTVVVAGPPDGLRLGCDRLGETHIGHLLCSPSSPADRCSSEVIVRIFGGPDLEAALSPYTERIARTFVPAHTRVRFIFGPHHPPELLGRGQYGGPNRDRHSLATLDPQLSRALGEWVLPHQSIETDELVATLDVGVLDETFVLH